MVAWLGTRWYGRRVGLLSGFIQLTPFYVLMQARLAEADMLLCLWVTMAMVLFAAAHLEPACQPRRRRPMVWGFYTAVGLTFMTKFSIGPAFVLGGCGLYILMNRAWPVLPALVSPVGWLILLLLLWPMLAYRQEPDILSAWWMHNVGRFSGRMGMGLLSFQGAGAPLALDTLDGGSPMAGAGQGVSVRRSWVLLSGLVPGGPVAVDLERVEGKALSDPPPAGPLHP
ncbi:MAG: phospholipid carrier-dependent glycosyltransferase [Planctomycetes bacterium]|nr:phospholipid carrier-dependent glycosyltransferase [Planctomycetota bacterium]